MVMEQAEEKANNPDHVSAGSYMCFDSIHIINGAVESSYNITWVA